MQHGNREQADRIILKLREAELELSRRETAPEATSLSRAGGSPFLCHFKSFRDRPTATCRGLVWCVVSNWLVVSRFGSVPPHGPDVARKDGNGLRSVSSLLSGVFALAVPGGASPTLKTGNGESRSWVQIPPHPFFLKEKTQPVPARGGPDRRSKPWLRNCNLDHPAKVNPSLAPNSHGCRQSKSDQCFHRGFSLPRRILFTKDGHLSKHDSPEPPKPGGDAERRFRNGGTPGDEP